MNPGTQESRRSFLHRAAGAAILAAHAPFLTRARGQSTMNDVTTPAPLPLLGLRLQATRIDAQRRFYRDVLGLPIEREEAMSFSVRAGHTTLTFEEPMVIDEPNNPPFYHFAFNIPENRLEQALEWTRNRVPVIARADGREIHHFEAWNAHAFYFLDPSGNIVEFIARHTLPNAALKPFGPECIGDVSEIGLVATSVAAVVDQSKAMLGVSPYLGRRSDDFTALGDERGLFIVVPAGRPWFPLEGDAQRHAAIFPAVITTGGTIAGRPGFDGLPYEIHGGC